jgi:epidermal growth factor receptor substrate 15
VVAQGTGASSASRAKSPQPGLPPFTPQDKAKFQNMFLKSGPVDGLLSGVLG